MAMISLHPEREDRWAEEKRQEKIAQGTALEQCSDGVWRTSAERIGFEASRALNPPSPQ